jgi:hypothetical protein
MPVSGRLCGTTGGGANHDVPPSRCLSAAGIRFLGPPVPAGELSSPRGRPTGHRMTGARTPTGFPRCARTRSDWGGRPLYPGNSGVLRPLVASHGRRLPPLNGRFLDSGNAIHRPELVPDETSTRGSLIVRPSSLPLRLWSPDGTGTLGLDPLSSAPRSYPQRTSEWGRTLDTGPELHLQHRTSTGEFTRIVRPRVAPDMVPSKPSTSRSLYSPGS